MFRLDAKLKVYVHREAVDFRKSTNGLAALLEQSMGLDPFAPARDAHLPAQVRCAIINGNLNEDLGFSGNA
jgi:hypothetical protein